LQSAKLARANHSIPLLHGVINGNEMMIRLAVIMPLKQPVRISRRLQFNLSAAAMICDV
jgi:hypothetical protein